MTDVPITVAIFNHGQWEALIDGGVRVKGAAATVTTPADVYERMVRHLEYDIAEIAFTTFLAARSFAIPIHALPVFSNRDVTMTPIVYNVKSGITKPKDLEGKRVGLRAYTVTNNTQARALLKSEFGVDTDKVTWVVTEEAHVQQYKNPPNVEFAPAGTTLEELLQAGEIDAGMQLSIAAEGDIRKLLTEEEASEVGLRFFRRTGVYPIGHVMTIKDASHQVHPWLAEAMFRAFTESKQVYLAGLDQRSPLGPRDRQSIRNRELLGGADPLPFGLRANHASLEAMIQMDYEQKIIPAPIAVESLFAPGVLDLA